MATTTPKLVHSLVIDAGPIIKNDPPISTLLAQAESLYTIPAVIDEIRDPVTRNRLETTLLPFLTLRSPAAPSIKFVQDFARKTGDLEVLSRPDIHLMALAYELECERNHGDWRLRNTPGQKGVNGTPPKSLEAEPSELVPVNEDSELFTIKSPVTCESERRGAWGTTIPASIAASTCSEKCETIEEAMENTHISTKELPLVPNTQMESIDLQPKIEEAQLPIPPAEDSQDSDEMSDSDEDGWITPSNLKRHQEKHENPGGVKGEPKNMQVAIMTTDFSMQNVLLRININLLTASFNRIRQLKMWVLRCHACFQITKDMTKQFCPRCGKPTLLRTSCSTEKDGTFKIHLKKNMQWNNRGNVFSVPKPVAGSSNGKLVSGGGKGGWGQGLILAEDQKEYAQAIAGARRKKEKDLMDEDYLPSILAGSREKTGRVKIGAGKNVNAKKRK